MLRRLECVASSVTICGLYIMYMINDLGDAYIGRWPRYLRCRRPGHLHEAQSGSHSAGFGIILFFNLDHIKTVVELVRDIVIDLFFRKKCSRKPKAVIETDL